MSISATTEVSPTWTQALESKNGICTSFKTESDFLNFCSRTFPEVNLYTGACDASPDGNASEISEKKRTERSLLSLYWILKKDEVGFTREQTPALSGDSFKEIYNVFSQMLEKHEDEHAMLVTLAIHDLGKMKWLQKEIGKLNHPDHDQILSEVLQDHPHLLPSFNQLSEDHKNFIKAIWGMGLNVGQLTQAECLPKNLEKMIEARAKNPTVVDFHFAHETLDVCGVLGHIKPTAGAYLNENIWNTYRLAWECAQGGSDALSVYDNFLRARGDRIGLKFEDRALIRLCCMGRCFTAEAAQPFIQAFKQLDEQTRSILVTELNKTGFEGSSACLLYYSPQFFDNLKKKNYTVMSLEKGLSILAYMLQQVKEAQLVNMSEGVYTLNMSHLCTRVLEGDFNKEDIIFDFKNGKVTYGH